MTKNKMTIVNNFDRIAPYYDLLVQLVFGDLLRRAEGTFLSEVKPGDHVLIMGGGTGRIITALNGLDVPMNITFVDSSAKMIRKAETVAHGPRLKISFVQEPMDSLQQGTFDRILSFYFLDCFTDDQLTLLVTPLAKRLSAKGSWLFADFMLPKTRWQRWLISMMYRFFGLVCNLETNHIPDYEKHFNKAGLILSQKQIFAQGLIESRVYRRIRKV